MQTRRNFIKMSGAFAIAGLASDSILNDAFAASHNRIKTYGIQLYSVRDVIPKDPKDTLAKLAKYGYQQIEGYEGPKGLWWGMGNKEFKNYIDGIGLNMVSSHCAWTTDFERKAAEAAEVGLKYLMCPYLGEQKTMDDYKRFANEFNKKGEICKRNGLRFAYHNHEYSFKAINGELPQDVMMKIADPALVDFEMDMYWVVTAGQDIETWLKKYPGRFKLCHIKDRMHNTDARDASCTLGTGKIDYKSIIKNSKQYGMEYFIVEQEKYEGTTPMDAAKADAKYLRRLKA
jgi:sugar phosphate isomerase/epimerase